MLLQPYKSDFILAIIKAVEAHEDINNLTQMKNSEVKNKHKIKTGISGLFNHLVFQAQEIPIWKINETQIHHLFTFGNTTMGSYLLGDLCSNGKLDKRKSNIRYSKYT